MEEVFMLRSRLNYVLLFFGMFVLSLNQVHAAAEDPVSVGDQLKAVRRAIMWSKVPDVHDLKVGDETEKEYGYSGDLSPDIFKTYADLLYSIAAADGELGVKEEGYIASRFKLIASTRVDAEAAQETAAYVAASAQQAREGKYKGVDLTNLVDAHIGNAKKLLGLAGVDSNILLKATAMTVLADSIMAARVDGFAMEERTAALNAAKHFGVSEEEFRLINEYSKFQTLLNRYSTLAVDNAFAADVKRLSASVRDFFAQK
jgi:hypothetical protein